MMWDGYWGMGSWMSLVFMLSFLVAIVLAVVFLIRALAGPGGRSATDAEPSASRERRDPPEEILKRRYASGEIDREEYLQRLEDLHRSPAA